MKPISFIANHPDNMHCVNAVFRMIHNHYFGQDMTWEELDQLTHAIPGKATWTFVGEMEFAKKGLNVINIEPIDYQALYDQGIGYLNSVVGPETAKYYFDRSNIASVLQYIPEYLRIVHHETRRAGVQEVIELVKAGNLIGAEINSHILNNKPGFGLHFVLIYGYDGENLILHDPGLPPIEARQVSPEEFDRCFNFEGANGGIAVFSLPEK